MASVLLSALLSAAALPARANCGDRHPPRADVHATTFSITHLTPIAMIQHVQVGPEGNIVQAVGVCKHRQGAEGGQGYPRLGQQPGRGGGRDNWAWV